MNDSLKKLLDDLSVSMEKMSPAVLGPQSDNNIDENIQFAWNNYYGSWIDNGWNNYYGSWSDKGWNNYYGSWSDGGWNNYYGSWSDKGWNNYYGSWGDGSGSGGGGCFLTTACVDNKGLPDDCYELQTLRAIRDTIVTWNDDMKRLVDEYYHIAPSIVIKINALDNNSQVWNDLYENLVLKCVSFYEDDKINDAVQLYIQTVNDLKNKYLCNE